jgi:hypothetical protein
MGLGYASVSYSTQSRDKFVKSRKRGNNMLTPFGDLSTVYPSLGTRDSCRSIAASVSSGTETTKSKANPTMVLISAVLATEEDAGVAYLVWNTR